MLGQTLEWVELPDDLVGLLKGKSSLGRLGLLIHSTAGYVDPGWKGNLTLELSNVANLPIALYRGMKIGQISFYRMTSPVERPYGSRELGSKYQGQSTPTESQFYQGLRGAAPCRDQGRPKALMALSESVDWRADLGGGDAIALIQAGTFTTDAGAAFGPVPRTMWQRLVEAEMTPDRHAQPGTQLPAGGDAGRARADRDRASASGWTSITAPSAEWPASPSCRRCAMPASTPHSVDIVALSHLHFDHAGGLLTTDGERAFPRARVVAQAGEWDVRAGLDNPRLQASYEQADLRLVEPWAAGRVGRR